LYRKRAIKESINIELSTEMIEMLELIIPIYGVFFNFFCIFFVKFYYIFTQASNFLYEYDLFGTISWQSLVILGVGVLYMIIPMEDVNEALFKIESKNEILTYEQVEMDFDTVKTK